MQIQAIEDFAEKLFLLALQVVPLARQSRVVLLLVTGNKTVTVKQSVAPSADRELVCRGATFGLMTHERVLGLVALFPLAGGQFVRGAFQWTGPFVVADGVMPVFGRNGVKVNTRAAAAVCIKVRGFASPDRMVAREHRQQLIAHIFGAAHMTVGQQRPHPKRLPGERQIAVVINSRAFEVLARNLQLRVIEEDFALTSVQQPAWIGLVPDPGDKLVQQFAQSGDTFLGLFAQPLTDLGLIGKLADPEQL